MCDYVRKIHSDTLRFKEEWKRNVAELKKHMIPPEPHETWKDAMGMSAAEFHYLKNPPRGYMKEQNEYSLWINRMRLAALRVDENLPFIRYLPEEHEHDFEESIEFMVEECDYLRDNENFNGPEPPLPGENGFFSDVGIAFNLEDLAYIPPDGGSHLQATYSLDSQSDLIKKLMALLNARYKSDKAKVEADNNPEEYTVPINDDTGYMRVEKSLDYSGDSFTNSMGVELHDIAHNGFHYVAEFSRAELERDEPMHYCAKFIYTAHKSLKYQYYYIKFLGSDVPIGIFIPNEGRRETFEKCKTLPRKDQEQCFISELRNCNNMKCSPTYLGNEEADFSGDKTVVGVFVVYDKYENMFENCKDLHGMERDECFFSEVAEIRRLADQQTMLMVEDYPYDELDEWIRRLDEQVKFVNEALKKLERVGIKGTEAEQKQENNHDFNDPGTTDDTSKSEENYANWSVDKICEYIAQNGGWSECNVETQVQLNWPRFCSERRERYCGTEDAEFKNKNIDIWTPELREKRNAAFRICRFLRHLSSKDTCPEWIIFSSLSDIERYVVSMLECSKDLLHETPCHTREECAQSGCVKQVVPWCSFFDLEAKLACIEDLKEFGRLTTREVCEQYLAPWIEWSTCRHNHQYILSESKICKDVHYRLCETEGMDPEVREMLDPKRSDEKREELMACWQYDFITQREEYYECVRNWARGVQVNLESLIKLKEELPHSENEDDSAKEHKDSEPWRKDQHNEPQQEQANPVEESLAQEPVIEHRPCFRKEYEKLETWVPAECDEQYLEDMRKEAAFLGNATENQGHNCSAELSRNAWNYAKNMMFCLYEVHPASRNEHLPSAFTSVPRNASVTSASEAVFRYVRHAVYKECNVFYIKDISKNFKGIMAQRSDNKAFYHDESLGNVLTFCKATKEINEIGHTEAVQLLRNILISKVIYESHSKPETLDANFERLVAYRSKKLPLVEEPRSVYKNDHADNTLFDETMDPGDLFLIQKRCDMIEASINPEIDTIVGLSKKPVPSEKQLGTLVDYWLDFVGNSDVDSDDPQMHLAEFSKILTGKYPQVCASYITFTVCVRLQIAFVGMTNRSDLEFKCNDLIASLKQ